MQPFAIVDFFDEIGKPVLDIDDGPVFPEIDLLSFEGFHETFGNGVIVRIAPSGHADLEATDKKRVHVVMGGILDPLVRVMDDPFRGFARPDRHIKCLQAKGRIDETGDGISDGLAGKQIQDDRQVHKRGLDGDVGDIRYPHLVRTDP